MKIKSHTKPKEDSSAATIRATTRGLMFKTAPQETLGRVYKTAPQISNRKKS